jgi:hypothetical protein
LRVHRGRLPRRCHLRRRFTSPADRGKRRRHVLAAQLATLGSTPTPESAQALVPRQGLSPREIGRSAHCPLQHRGPTMGRSALRPQRCLISICISGSAPRSSSLVLPAGPGRVSGWQPLARFPASNAGTSARSPLTFRTSKRETTKHAQVEQVAVVNPTAGSGRVLAPAARVGSRP